MIGTLHLHRIVFADPLGLQLLARHLRLPDHPFDPDYVVHCLLGELAGTGRVKPFVEDPRARGKAVLGYSMLDITSLRERARAVAPPDVYRLVDWERSQSKDLPTGWEPGTQLGFRVRVCPLVRGPSAHGAAKTDTKKSRPEVDAYLARCWRDPHAPDRETVYREWLHKELERDGAAQAEQVRMTGFRLKRAVRRDSNRKATAITRPDAVFKGILRIEEPEAFQRLVARGIGRHRDFGFGLLLLTVASA